MFLIVQIAFENPLCLYEKSFYPSNFFNWNDTLRSRTVSFSILCYDSVNLWPEKIFKMHSFCDGKTYVEVSIVDPWGKNNKLALLLHDF